MSATLREHVPGLRTAQAACSSPEVPPRSDQSLLQFLCASESSLHDKGGQLKNDKTCLEEQCELEAWCSGRTCDVLDKASASDRTSWENIREVRVLYDQELADLRNEQDGLQVSRPPMAFTVKLSASFYVLPMSVWRRIESLLCSHHCVWGLL